MLFLRPLLHFFFFFKTHALEVTEFSRAFRNDWALKRRRLAEVQPHCCIHRHGFFSQCYCLPGAALFWVDESILESTLGRKKLRRTNHQRRDFLSQHFKKRMQTACYFVWPTLKFGEKKAVKCQSIKLALLSSGFYPQVLQVTDTTQLLLKY